MFILILKVTRFIFLWVLVLLAGPVSKTFWNKVWFKKKFTHISAYYANSDCFGEKSLKSAKSTHAKDSKMVRQVHIVPKLLPGSMINHKNYFWEITKFVKKWFAKKGDLAFLSIM